MRQAQRVKQLQPGGVRLTPSQLERGFRGLSASIQLILNQGSENAQRKVDQFRLGAIIRIEELLGGASKSRRAIEDYLLGAQEQNPDLLTFFQNTSTRTRRNIQDVLCALEVEWSTMISQIPAPHSQTAVIKSA